MLSLACQLENCCFWVTAWASSTLFMCLLHQSYSDGQCGKNISVIIPAVVPCCPHSQKRGVEAGQRWSSSLLGLLSHRLQARLSGAESFPPMQEAQGICHKLLASRTFLHQRFLCLQCCGFFFFFGWSKYNPFFTLIKYSGAISSAEIPKHVSLEKKRRC